MFGPKQESVWDTQPDRVIYTYKRNLITSCYDLNVIYLKRLYINEILYKEHLWNEIIIFFWGGDSIMEVTLVVQF